MHAAKDENLLAIVNDILELAITDYINDIIMRNNQEIYSLVDPLLKLILQNNGCSFTDNSMSREWRIEDDYYVTCITGAKGNDVNVFYDFIDFNGTSYLVVFLDYFLGVHKEYDEDMDEINKIANEFIGNSNYFHAIECIVDTFINTAIANPFVRTSSMASTAAATNYRYASKIIAGSIINSIKPLTENDVEGIDYETLINLIDNFSLALLGIRNLE